MRDRSPAVDERGLAIIPRVCIAVVVEYDGGRVLLLRRSESSTFPRTWCLPGGRLDPGETLEQCCRRELLEETGLSAERFTFECVTEVAGPLHLIGLVYKAHRATGTAANAEPDKHDEIGLFRPCEFPSPLMPGVVQWLQWLSFPMPEGRGFPVRP
jgi:8-oxo-dGTP diphosphatase